MEFDPMIDETDCPGRDIRINVPAETFEDCLEICRIEPKCATVTYSPSEEGV